MLVPSIYPHKQKFAFTNIVSYLNSPIGGQILVSSTKKLGNFVKKNLGIGMLVLVMLNLEVDGMHNRIQMWHFQGAKWEYWPGVCAIYDTHPTLIRVQKGREPIKQSM